MDVKSKCEIYWADLLKSKGATRVYPGRCDDEDVDTPFIVCRCEEAPVTMPGGGAHRIDPLEILVISHISEATSKDHSEAVEWVRSVIEHSSFPDTGAEIKALGVGPLTVRDVASEDDERYADILEFVFGFTSHKHDETLPVPPGLAGFGLTNS